MIPVSPEVFLERKRCMAKTTQVDMLNGTLADKMVKFALPLAASSILQQLFNAADLAVVGRFASSQAMAAVGSNSSVISLILNLFIGLSVGANVLVAGLIGKGQKDKINEAVHSIITIAAVSGVIMIALGTIVAPRILVLMGAPEEVMNLATLYLRIYFWAMPALMVYNFGSSVLRSKGDSKRPLMAMSAAGVINVVLNLILVIFFKLHVIGVAVATVVSNLFSAGIILYILMHEEEAFRLNFSKLKINMDNLRAILKVGLPAGLQGIIFSLSNIVIQSSINSFGADAIAGSTAAQNFEFMVYCVINAFSQTAVTFTSQNFSARKFDRRRKIFTLSMAIGLCAGAVTGGIFALLRNHVIQLFTTDPAVIHFALIRILIVCLLDWMTGLYEISGGCLRGMGRSMTPAMLTVVGSCGVRLIWVWTVVRAFHEFHILVAVYPVSWLITGAMVLTAYFIARKQLFFDVSAN